MSSISPLTKAPGENCSHRICIEYSHFTCTFNVHVTKDSLVLTFHAQTWLSHDIDESGLQVEVVSGMHHLNVATLIGYCDEEGEQILVYEFVPCGTLEEALRPKPGLASIAFIHVVCRIHSYSKNLG